MTASYQSVKSLDEWTATEFRLTVFLTSALDLSGAVSWRDLTGELPDARQVEPKLGISEESGIFEDGSLILRAMPGRIDLTHNAIIKSPFIFSIPTLGAFAGSVARFREIAASCLDKLSAIEGVVFERLAFGVGLDMEASGHEEAYNILNQLLHDVKVNPKSTDFFYSINRIRKSTVVQDVDINRLSKWAARVLRISMMPEIPQELQPNSSGIYSCHIELDINTVQRNDFTLQKDKINDVFAELIAMASEIAEYGDIP